ncbi:MAG: hypothetical protein CM15mP117_14370 [Alphaproteobacteria bacterium]|nr:MAG: hypothetical protein CM15mP117_14370 [Alphaproteobacteria bacterium]
MINFFKNSRDCYLSFLKNRSDDLSGDKLRTSIGLAIIGCGDIGKARAQFARMYPAVEWIGVCDVNLDLATYWPRKFTLTL